MLDFRSKYLKTARVFVSTFRYVLEGEVGFYSSSLAFSNEAFTNVTKAIDCRDTQACP